MFKTAFKPQLFQVFEASRKFVVRPAMTGCDISPPMKALKIFASIVAVAWGLFALLNEFTYLGLLLIIGGIVLLVRTLTSRPAE